MADFEIPKRSVKNKIFMFLWMTGRIILFTLILVLIILQLNKIFVPKYYENQSQYPTTSTYEQFYRMSQNSIDVIFLGTSVCVNSFNPQELYNKYGIRSYNLGSEQQSPMLSYFWLKEALRFQEPSTVILETKLLFYPERESYIGTPEPLTRKCVDPMKPSYVKSETVDAVCDIDENQTALSYLFTNIRFHDRWKDLSESDFRPSFYSSAMLKGYSPLIGNAMTEHIPFSPMNNSEKADINSLQKIYLDKICELCKDNNIELILVTVPAENMSDGMNNTLTEYAEEKNIAYYNFDNVEYYNRLNVVHPVDKVDGHSNLYGAIKLSNLLGELLIEKHKVPSYRDAQWEATKGYYKEIIDRAELVGCYEFEEYLSRLKNKNYTVFMSVYGDASKLSDRAREELRELGLAADLSEYYIYGYYAVIYPDKVVEELNRERTIEYSGTIRDGEVYFLIKSAGFAAGEVSSIIIDGVEYSKGLTGFNIVVYDNENRLVIDSVNFGVSSFSDSSAGR